MSQGYDFQTQGSSSSTDIVTQLQNIARQLGTWVQAFRGRMTTGTFTCTAATSTIVVQPAVQSNSIITFTATNPTAGALMGSARALYLLTLTPGASFTIATANGVAAGGTETFSYVINTPS